MIIVQLIGGLGNQLFQYALGRHLAIKTKTELKLDVCEFNNYKLRAYGLNNFKIMQNNATINEINRLKYGTNLALLTKALHFINKISYKLAKRSLVRKSTFIEESSLPFCPDILQLSGNVYLKGYWQSEKYFSEIKEVLYEDLELAEQLDWQNNKLLNEISCGESASIHVRRGDYVADPKASKIYASCDACYYTRAVEIIRKQHPLTRFFIFSDDPDWAETNLKISNSVVVRCNDASKNYADLHLMRNCQHNIIANSTFSWWGAWLNKNPNKIVIAPQAWFNNASTCSKDLIPKNWIQI
ncbi:MAG: alpha-1,2-fucosyltransferase [Erysipelotrichia bacterium]|nr:alpha-1,2-fucosyltransferase [Erysipelotrichia bacterium]